MVIYFYGAWVCENDQINVLDRRRKFIHRVNLRRDGNLFAAWFALPVCANRKPGGREKAPNNIRAVLCILFDIQESGLCDEKVLLIEMKVIILPQFM